MTSSPSASSSGESAALRSSSPRTRSGDAWSQIPLFAWGIQVVGLIMSYASFSHSDDPPRRSAYGAPSSADVYLLQATTGVILILAVLGALTAIYLAAADNKLGAAVLSIVLAGISLSVSLTIGCFITAETSSPSGWIYLVNIIPVVVLLASTAALNKHAASGRTTPSRADFA